MGGRDAGGRGGGGLAASSLLKPATVAAQVADAAAWVPAEGDAAPWMRLDLGQGTDP